MSPFRDINEGGKEGSDNRGELTEPQERRFRGGVWATASAFGASGFAFVNFTLLSRILGPEIFGLMAMVEASLALGQRLLASGLAEPLIQIRRLRADHADTLFWTLQAIGLGLVAVMVLLRGLVEQYFVQDGLAELVTAASFILYLQATGAVPRALLAREFRFAATAQAAISAEAVGGIVGLTLALTGHGVWSLIFLRLAATLVETLTLWRKAAWIPHPHWSLGRFHELWRFSASRGLEGFLHFLDNQIPRFVLGRVAGAAELGRFVFARRLIDMTATALLSPVKALALPTFAQMQGNLDEVRSAYRHGARLTESVVFPACAGIALTAPALVPLVFGEKWIAAVPLIQLFSLNAFRRSLNIWNSGLLRGLGKPQWLLIASVWRTFGTMALIFLLLPFGSIGVCGAILMGTFLSWPIAMRFVSRLTGLGVVEQLRCGISAFGATAIMAVALLILRHPIETHLSPWIGAAAMIAAGAAVYLAALAWLGREELVGLVTLLRNLNVMRKKSSPGEQEEAGESLLDASD